MRKTALTSAAGYSFVSLSRFVENETPWSLPEHLSSACHWPDSLAGTASMGAEQEESCSVALWGYFEIV